MSRNSNNQSDREEPPKRAGRIRQSSFGHKSSRLKHTKRRRSNTPESSAHTNTSDGNVSDDEVGESGRSENTETAVETSDGNDTSIIEESDDNAPSSRNNSDWETTTITSSQSSRSLRHRKHIDLGELAKNDNEFDAMNQVEHDPKTVQQYNVRVRIAEAKELQGSELNPLVRVYIDGKSRATRIRRSTDAPRWDQTLSFSFTKSLEQINQTDIEFGVYSARRMVRDSLLGTFQCNLGLIYIQKHHTIVDKWLALTPGGRDRSESENNGAEICGFLKVSISVYRSHQNPPSLSALRTMKTENAYDDVLFRAQLLNYTLRVS
uniref:C2 domain-containing protein n=1 Tax=Steinernema glaseri TaxID=37863 RepID=A0A1I7YW21_9BILA